MNRNNRRRNHDLIVTKIEGSRKIGCWLKRHGQGNVIFLGYVYPSIVRMFIKQFNPAHVYRVPHETMAGH